MCSWTKVASACLSLQNAIKLIPYFSTYDCWVFLYYYNIKHFEVILLPHLNITELIGWWTIQLYVCERRSCLLDYCTNQLVTNRIFFRFLKPSLTESWWSCLTYRLDYGSVHTDSGIMMPPTSVLLGNLSWWYFYWSSSWKFELDMRFPHWSGFSLW